MRNIVVYLILTSFGLLFSCGKKACQSPPPTLRFMLMEANGKNLITDANAGKVSVQYTNGGQLIRVSDVQLSASTTYAFTSYEMIPIARQSADTTHFYVLINNKTVGPIQLKTYVDNSECDGWTHISELRFEGRLIAYDNMKPGYVLMP